MQKQRDSNIAAVMGKEAKRTVVTHGMIRVKRHLSVEILASLTAQSLQGSLIQCERSKRKNLYFHRPTDVKVH